MIELNRAVAVGLRDEEAATLTDNDVQRAFLSERLAEVTARLS